MAQRAPINLDEFKAKIRDESAVDIVTAAGNTYTVLPPELLSDDDARAMAALLADDDADPVAMARIILGDDYDRFVADGGNALLLAAILGEMSADRSETQGASTGESSAS